MNSFNGSTELRGSKEVSFRDKLIAVDELDNEIGWVSKEEAHKVGILHRAISVFVFNEKGEWLLQQRAKTKYHCPMQWSNAACTHPLIGETNAEAARRRLMEELGLDLLVVELFPFLYRAELDNGLIEHEYDHVFVAFSNETPDFNPSEVNTCKYWSQSKLKKAILDNPEQFTPWFKLIVESKWEELTSCLS